MNTFIDTAALLAVLNAKDIFHRQARDAWNVLLSSNTVVTTSNYVLIETIALLQHRYGTEAVRLLKSDILPVLDIFWIDEAIHQQGLSAMLAANRRQLSLVDCTSFEIMRQRGLDIVFTFDPHFIEQGFTLFPESKSSV